MIPSRRQTCPSAPAAFMTEDRYFFYVDGGQLLHQGPGKSKAKAGGGQMEVFKKKSVERLCVDGCVVNLEGEQEGRRPSKARHTYMLSGNDYSIDM